MKEKNNSNEKKERTPTERKFSLTAANLKELQNTQGLLEAFLDAYEQEPETITPLLLAQAKGAIRQQKLNV